MLTVKRTNSEDTGFHELVSMLDAELAVRDGKDHPFFAQYNKLDSIRHVIVASDDGILAGCGAIRKYDELSMEIKRMFVKPEYRNRGIARAVLSALELWAAELGNRFCILETGKRQPEAIGLYRSCGYLVIPNYGQYINIQSSVCMKKDLEEFFSNR